MYSFSRLLLSLLLLIVCCCKADSAVACADGADVCPSTAMASDLSGSTGATPEESQDYKNYFRQYSYLSEQKSMLADTVRMQAYHEAIMTNKNFFKGKTVLDIGSGSGVLAMWSAQAGAKKVYAIEATRMATTARRLVEVNGLSHIVDVIQSSVEDIDLPCGPGGVDVIVSEWMGLMLLRESMLDSVIKARDKWLKPSSGLMFPSHATMYISAVTFEADRLIKVGEKASVMADWKQFAMTLKSQYNVDYSVLQADYEKEYDERVFNVPDWIDLDPKHLVGESVIVKSLDLHTCTLEDAEGVRAAPFSILIPFPTKISGFVNWFTTDFAGSDTNPVDSRVVLSTSPDTGYTHWGQHVFYFSDFLLTPKNTILSGSFSMLRKDSGVNKRLYNTQFTVAVDGGEEKLHAFKEPAF